MPLRKPPGFIIPCAPELRDEPPGGPDWLHEVKYDGWRMIARHAGAEINLWSRSTKEHVEDFPRIAAAMRALPEDATIDGEVVLDLPGGLDFHGLSSGEGQASAVLVAFDLLVVAGVDMRGSPIEERRALLGQLVAGIDGIVFSEAFEAEGAIVFEHACRMGLEGIVSKRRGSRYQAGLRRTGSSAYVQSISACVVRYRARQAASLVPQGAVAINGLQISVQQPALAAAIKVIQAAVPEALDHFGITPESIRDRIIAALPHVPAVAQIQAAQAAPQATK